MYILVGFPTQLVLYMYLHFRNIMLAAINFYTPPIRLTWLNEAGLTATRRYWIWWHWQSIPLSIGTPHSHTHTTHNCKCTLTLTLGTHQLHTHTHWHICNADSKLVYSSILVCIYIRLIPGLFSALHLFSFFLSCNTELLGYGSEDRYSPTGVALVTRALTPTEVKH